MGHQRCSLGDADGSQEGRSIWAQGCQSLQPSCQLGIRSWPSGWNSQDCVWVRQVWKRFSLRVFSVFWIWFKFLNEVTHSPWGPGLILKQNARNKT